MAVDTDSSFAIWIRGGDCTGAVHWTLGVGAKEAVDFGWSYLTAVWATAGGACSLAARCATPGAASCGNELFLLNQFGGGFVAVGPASPYLRKIRAGGNRGAGLCLCPPYWCCTGCWARRGRQRGKRLRRAGPGSWVQRDVFHVGECA